MRLINNTDGLLTAEATRFHASGFLSAACKEFRIDHPLDPENKYLNHVSVESPEARTIYDGTVVTDSEGLALVALPGYCTALNDDFRYQLTVVGARGVAWVSKEAENGVFEVGSDPPSVKVCWQVTGARKDPFILVNPPIVEELKAPADRGFYLHPEAYGLPPERGEAARQVEASKAGSARSLLRPRR